MTFVDDEVSVAGDHCLSKCRRRRGQHSTVMGYERRDRSLLLWTQDTQELAFEHGALFAPVFDFRFRSGVVILVAPMADPLRPSRDLS